MGDSFPLCCGDKHRRVMIFFALLLISTSTQKRLMVQAAGRGGGSLSFTTTNDAVKVDHRQVETNQIRNRALIGSSPPRCERRCSRSRSSSCVHCEAIQVPIAPQRSKIKQTTGKTTSRSSSTKSNGGNIRVFSRSDDVSNYKPMRWKCKCGGSIFNP